MSEEEVGQPPQAGPLCARVWWLGLCAIVKHLIPKAPSGRKGFFWLPLRVQPILAGKAWHSQAARGEEAAP